MVLVGEACSRAFTVPRILQRFAFVDPFYLNLLNLLISFTNFVFNTWSASNCFSISGGRTLRQERTGASRDAEDIAVHNRSSIVCFVVFFVRRSIFLIKLARSFYNVKILDTVFLVL